ncbi:MAG: hypothetical protein CL942_04040 [Desulfovibrio sp.]|nr:hypothetical protein [Desulfovibrio sp.]
MINSYKNNRSLINFFGVPIILSSIYYDFLFPYFILIILCACTFEYVKLVNKLNSRIATAFLLPFNIIAFMNSLLNICDTYTLIILFFIICFSFEVFFYNESSTQNISFNVMGFILIGCCLAESLINIRFAYNGFYYTLLLFLSVWICDTFAYFFGSKFGKTKILPAISPNKTWVGSFSGIIGSFIVAFSFYYFDVVFALSYNISEVDVVLISVITGIFGQLGDFAESVMKRQVNIKDTGTILLGHGGFLDRFDSIIFAAPLYYIYLKNSIL